MGQKTQWEGLTMTGFFTISLMVPIRMLRQSRMMLSHLVVETLGLFFLGGTFSADGCFPNWGREGEGFIPS